MTLHRGGRVQPCTRPASSTRPSPSNHRGISKVDSQGLGWRAVVIINPVPSRLEGNFSLKSRQNSRTISSSKLISTSLTSMTMMMKVSCTPLWPPLNPTASQFLHTLKLSIKSRYSTPWSPQISPPVKKNRPWSAYMNQLNFSNSTNPLP